MHYFLTNHFEYNISGIEHAQVYRWQEFERIGVPAKVVTFDYTPALDVFLYRHKIPRRASLNMFDYWQGATDAVLPSQSMTDWAIHGSVEVINYSYQFPTPYDATRNQIATVRFYDYNHQITAEETWDIRGFRSLRLDYAGGKVVHRTWFNVTGEPVIEQVEDNLILIDKANPQYVDGGNNTFDSWSELKSAWLDHLVDHDNGAVLYIDRSEYVAPLVFNMQHNNVPTYVVLHSSHTYDNNDPMNSPLNDVRQYEIDHKEHIKAYIASTPEQAHDFMERTGMPTYTIPVAYIKKEKFAEHNGKRLVYLSRISREKRVDHAIRVAAKIIATHPDYSLDIFGYVTDGNYNKELKALINELGVQNQVHLRAYSSERDVIFHQTDLFILTSEYEGFNMSMLEGASFGIPSIAYDVNYGPRYLANELQGIEPVANGDIEAMAARVIEVLEDQDEYHQLQQRVYDAANEKFSQSAVTKLWDKFLQQEQLPQQPKNWFINQAFQQGSPLGPVNEALQQHTKQNGYQVIGYPNENQFDDGLQQINAGDLVLINYPTFYLTMDTKGGYDLHLVEAVQERGAKVALVVGDSQVLRE